MMGKHGGNRRRLDTKTKSNIIYQHELRSVALVNDLERKLSCLEKEKASIKDANRVLGSKFRDASSRVDQIQEKIQQSRGWH